MARRPLNFNQAVKALIRDAAAQMAEFRHVRAGRIVVVAGEARRASRATVKPLAFEGGRSTDSLGRKKPVVRLKGRKMLYCITLRPLFFRSSTPRARIATLLHELFHVSPAFDGTLAPTRRHDRLGKKFDRQLRPIVLRYLRRCPREIRAPFAHDGEVRVQQWLERPGALYSPGRGGRRRVYTEEQLFQGVVRMVTRKVKLKAKSKRKERTRDASVPKERARPSEVPVVEVPWWWRDEPPTEG